MPLEPKTLADLLDHGFDAVIDVRSPAEFAEDHVPGAINLPVLDNAERAEVGTIYVQQSRFLARKIGAAKVFHNAAAHIAGPLADKPGGWQPLVYCWRGGQRSGSFAWMLGEIGWRVDTIEGGYQTYRRLVHGMLYDAPLAHRLILLDGNTGTAKTDLLHMLAARGEQVLDLEGLAGHRGSLLGAMPGGQPGQKAFETALAEALSRLDPARPVLVEAESSKIGERLIPPSLWSAMKAAPRIELRAGIEDRVAYLLRAYDEILSDTDRLRGQLAPLKAHRGTAVIEHWFTLIDAGDKAGLTRSLMVDHYDLAYARSRRANGSGTARVVQLSALDDPGLESAATDVAEAMAQIGVL